MPKSSKKKEKTDNDVLERLRKLAKEHKDKDASQKDKKSKKKKKEKHDNIKAPMTKEDYEKKRSVITTEYDQETGRMRRVRATGEIMETIVTREQHSKINKTATLGDGLNYLSNLIGKAKQ